jgi:hypothetical protein
VRSLAAILPAASDQTDDVKRLLFIYLVACFGYAHQKQFDVPTPVSRLDLLQAFVNEGRVCIDTYHQNTSDKAVFEGHYYSDKAPGTAVVALPAFAVAAGVLKLDGVPLDSKAGWLVSSWVACAGSIAIVTALGGVALFAWLERQVPAKWALITTVALFLGAAPLPYATMMFSHAMVVGCLSMAIWVIDRNAACGVRGAEWSRAERSGAQGEMGSGVAGGPLSVGRCQSSAGRGRQTRHWSWARVRGWLAANRWDLVAGFVCGWALASEYSAGLVVVGLLVWLVLSSWRRAIPFCLAALPPLLLIPAYSWACFGDPFTLPYSHQASFPAMQEGLYAIKWPDLPTACALLFSPARGLFFWTPFLVMAGFGYWSLFERAPRMFWLTYLVPLLHLIVISGRTWDWPAGPTLGPRLLAPMLPLLALPCALGVQRFPKIGLVLAVFSIAMTTLATLTDACPSSSIYNPLTELHIPLFLKGQFSPNLGMVLGLPPYTSVALYYVILVGGFWWLWRKLPPQESPQTALNDVAKT